MKSRLLLIITCLIFGSGQAQETKKTAHSFEINAVYLPIMQRQIYEYSLYPIGFLNSSSRGGFKYGANLKYSFSIKKWFLDANLSFLNSRSSSQQAFIEDGQLQNISYRHNLNYLSPEFSFGRFFQVSKNFRMSFALGFGTSFLLNKKNQNFTIVLRGEDAGEDKFYEGQVSFYHNIRLAQSVQIGIYVPLGVNELSIKLIGYGGAGTTSYLNLNKIVDYAPQLLLEDARSSISSTMLGLSVGYRFNSFKSKQK